MVDSTIQGPDQSTPWYTAITNTVGFVAGFVIGGVTGYFGNWLWYRFGPVRKEPHFTMTSQDGRTSFSGVMTPENREPIIKALRTAETKPTTRKPTTRVEKPEVSDASSSGGGAEYS